ncbi:MULTISPECIES: GNAT family N-acetyltransferase [unclassified Crossiella]|uniref:GNAT family N-acetyltransferase n=1 Tax=unclassified Crossiella TaxID=2620835 RepID=UPI001FFE81B0|nr:MULTISPECIES: GNAT family N-acetyltransferase [unclassified Crossiella]MCK2242367.1 GNAT family N-acetyltransferase [Crossiella sp. S99.2]MCK2254602.1 GNAT family N-acetyltransferase [Crossiella sp. S99.1]
MELRTLAYDHPDATALIAEVQQEYVVRYGDEDITPVDPAEFAPPRGLFLVGYLDGVPMVCGGWRAHDADEPGFADGDAELKRMFVVQAARGRGLARVLLAELERTALAAGRRRMVLETGTEQPEAIALYTSSGYAPIAKFGVYAGYDNSRCFGKQIAVPAAAE